MTSSTRYFEVVGRTRPANRFTSINASPRDNRRRCSHTSSRASAQAFEMFVFFFIVSATRRFYVRREKGASGRTTSPHALPRQFSVLDAMGLVGRRPQTPVTVGFVILVIPLEPDDLALPLECQHVR